MLAPSIRRFQMADLSLHGAWFLERIMKAFPHRNQYEIAGWLQGMVYSNDHLFLFADFGAAMFERTQFFSLEATQTIIERFVFAQPGHEEQAAGFYEEAKQWAKSQGIQVMVVEEMTDVPHDLIAKAIGKLHTRQQVFAKI